MLGIVEAIREVAKRRFVNRILARELVKSRPPTFSRKLSFQEALGFYSKVSLEAPDRTKPAK